MSGWNGHGIFGDARGAGDIALRPGDGADETASIAGGMVVGWLMVMASAMAGQIVYISDHVGHDRGLYFSVSGFVSFNLTSLGS